MTLLRQESSYRRIFFQNNHFYFNYHGMLVIWNFIQISGNGTKCREKWFLVFSKSKMYINSYSKNFVYWSKELCHLAITSRGLFGWHFLFQPQIKTLNTVQNTFSTNITLLVDSGINRVFTFTLSSPSIYQ